MASSTLEQVRPGARIFIDAPIFIYHFTAASSECRAFLKRCETGEILGVTSVIVRDLTLYQEQVATIPLMEVEIVPLDLPVFAASGPLRRSHGLLTNDSLILSTARALEVAAVASADHDFDGLDEVALFCPGDLEPTALSAPPRPEGPR